MSTTSRVSACNDGKAGGSNFIDDNFEDCYCTDGHEEDDYLNDGQGVNETRMHIKKHPLLRW